MTRGLDTWVHMEKVVEAPTRLLVMNPIITMILVVAGLRRFQTRPVMVITLSHRTRIHLCHLIPFNPLTLLTILVIILTSITTNYNSSSSLSSNTNNVVLETIKGPYLPLHIHWVDMVLLILNNIINNTTNNTTNSTITITNRHSLVNLIVSTPMALYIYIDDPTLRQNHLVLLSICINNLYIYE